MRSISQLCHRLIVGLSQQREAGGDDAGDRCDHDLYSFVYALLLRPYAYADPDRLVQVESVYATIARLKGVGVRQQAAATLSNFHDRVLASLGALPGVADVA